VSDDGADKPGESMLTQGEYARAVYSDFKAAQRVTFDVAAGYGKWLIASLLLAHGGGLVGVMGLFKEAAREAATTQRIATTAWWLIAGLLLALCSGFTVWFNWSMISHNYEHQATAEMLWNPKKWLNPPIYTWQISLSYWLGIAFGILSGACILGAASSLLGGLG
jgi:hypothetical protein